MRLTFLGKESVPDQSPTLYVTDRDSYVVQGWIVTNPQIISVVPVADDETIVEVPPRLMVHLVKDGVAGDVVNIIRGRRVSDREALDQMDIPAHETCVEVSRSAVVALVGS